MPNKNTLRSELPSEIADYTLIVYARLYQLEIWLRELVYVELKANFGSDWWLEAELALKRSRFGGIKPEKSRRADAKHPHMSTPENDPLWFLSFDALLKIVFDRKLWKLFETYLTTKGLLKAKFEEIKPIRNRVAHCRSLHTDDLDRIKRLLRDIDKGLLKFCVSYNTYFSLEHAYPNDPVQHHFAAQRPPSSLDLALNYSIRPTARSRAKRKALPRKGGLYDFHFYFHSSTGRLMDFPSILSATRRWHKCAVHMVLDSFQQSFRVTFPAMLDPNLTIEAAEGFQHACRNNTTIIRYRGLGIKTMKDMRRENDRANRIFEAMAAEWPHYVLPPTNPLTFLDPDYPGTFFGA